MVLVIFTLYTRKQSIDDSVTFVGTVRGTDCFIGAIAIAATLKM
jgi:hypothetical protein